MPIIFYLILVHLFIYRCIIYHLYANLIFTCMKYKINFYNLIFILVLSIKEFRIVCTFLLAYQVYKEVYQYIITKHINYKVKIIRKITLGLSITSIIITLLLHQSFPLQIPQYLYTYYYPYILTSTLVVYLIKFFFKQVF